MVPKTQRENNFGDRPQYSGGVSARTKKTLRVVLFGLLIAVVSYLVAFALVFDTSRMAFSWHEDNTEGGQPVAFGPRPRWIFCRETPIGRYDGSEWVFVVFRPLCEIHAKQKGYALPAEWR